MALDLCTFDLPMTEMFDETPNCVAVFDERDCLVYANTAYREAFFGDRPGQSWADVMRENFRKERGPVIDCSDIEAWLTSATARRGVDHYRAFEVELHGGTYLWVTETMFPDGKMLLIASDISKLRPDTRLLRLQRDEALRTSVTDELTGIPNRRYATLQLEDWRAVQSCSRDREAACLAIIDIDHFKPINDVHGHDIGDRILVDFCKTFLDNIRLKDLFARIGGEEFVLFMPNCGRSEATKRLNEISAIVARSQPIHESPDLHYTFSAGLIQVCPDKEIDDWFRGADRLLYKAKAAGRNRIVV